MSFRPPDLRPEEWARMIAWCGRRLDYWERFRRRMHQRDWPAGHEMHRLVGEAIGVVLRIKTLAEEERARAARGEAHREAERRRRERSG